ncbi:hypothetical protein Esi_0189_0014 [Ectocarpus siliculosus]|uniref:Uncharacterized protein n=1 Tax=Ectocarpus siliculosus TaxID=2880 RepID=D7FPE4_ECTSI|nr:hypothetical protein Esi_0189_0014 [Ectocarpus siliculosus]|eukprot:CBJ30402.1 hypothetical protein Esi_0189_0014 [Ectocarpus siliculosus]
MQRTRPSENTTPGFDLVGTILTMPQSPVSSMSSLHFSEESGGEGSFRSWLRQTRKTRNPTVFAQGGKDENAIVSKDLIALARARQEREAREESDSSSISTSKSERSNRDDGRRGQVVPRGPTRTLTLSPSRRTLAVAPRVSFKTVGSAEVSLPPKSPQKQTVKTQGKDVRRSHLRADLVHGNDEQDNLKQVFLGGRGGNGVDVRKPEPERSNPDVSSTAETTRRIDSAANHKCMSSVDETRDEEGKENEDVSMLSSQTNASSIGGSSSANRPADPIPVDAASATQVMGNGPSVEATCVLADEDGAGAECTASYVESAANRSSTSTTMTSINQGADAFDMPPARDKKTSPFEDTSNVFPSKEGIASISTSKETASRRLHHQAAFFFDSTSDQPELTSPTGSGDQFLVESKGQPTDNKADTPRTTGGCFTPDRTQLQSVATLTLDPSRPMSFVLTDSTPKYSDEVGSASEGREPFLTESVLEKVIGDLNGKELRKEEGTDLQPEAISDENDGSEEKGTDQRHSKQMVEQERVAGGIEAAEGKGEGGPRNDEQTIFLDSNTKYMDEVASASEGMESVLGKVVGDSNGRQLRKNEGTDHQAEVVSGLDDGKEEEGADKCHSKQKAEQERVAGGVETAEGKGEEGPQIDKQPVFLDSKPERSDEVESASERREPFSTESVLEKVVGDLNGKDLRKEEGTDLQPEVVSDGNNGSEEERADQRHSKQKAEQERVAGGIETAEGKGAEGPRRDEQTPMVSLIRSENDEQNQREQPATDQTSCSQIERAPAKDGLLNQAGLLASSADVSRQQEASPITTNDSQTPRVGGSATAPDLYLPPELQRQTVTPPVPHDAPSSPVKPLDTNAGKDSRGTWGNENDSMDAFLVPDGIGLNDDRCGKSTRFLLPAQTEAQPKTHAQPQPPTKNSNGAFKDPWRARILAEATTVILNRGDIRGVASVSPPELTGRDGYDAVCCDDSLRNNEKETASPDFGSAALMEIRAFVAKDPWYTRILSEAAATLANGRDMQKPAVLAPSNVAYFGDGCDVGCGRTWTAREPVPVDSPTEPIVSDNAVIRSPFSSRIQAGVVGPNKFSCEGRWGSGGRERAQLVQQSTPTTTRGPRSVRDSWSMRILAEAAATLAICGVVPRSVLLSTVETVPMVLPSVRGYRRCGCAAAALSSNGGDSGSATGDPSPRMSLPILWGRRSTRFGDSGSTPRGRSPRMSLPILRARVGDRCVAEILPRWGCGSGLERFPGHPIIVDYGMLGCDLSDSPRILSRRCTACTSDNVRESPKPSATINNRTSFPRNPQHGHLGESTSEGEHVRAPTPPARRARSSDSVSACTPRSRIAEKIGLSAVARGGEDNVNLRLHGHVVFPAACWEGGGDGRGGDISSISGACRRRIYFPKAQHGPSDTSGR